MSPRRQVIWILVCFFVITSAPLFFFLPLFVALIFVVIYSLLFIGFYQYFQRTTFVPLKQISQNLQLLLHQYISGKDEIVSADEIIQISHDVEKLEHNLHKTTTFIAEIGNGNLQDNARIMAEQDAGEMNKALMQMRKQLIELAEEERKRNWITSGLAQAGEILRNDSHSAEQVYQHILTFIIKYLNANQGGLFVVNDKDEKNIMLELVMCYAYERRKYQTKQIHPGEGLVGQCYLERNSIYLTDIPDKYIKITSGLGLSTPKSLLLVPLISNEEILGVMELASFQEFQEYQIDFLKKAGESIATTIASVKRAVKTQQLLENSQLITEELKNQEEELKQNAEELQATQEEISRKYELLFKEFNHFNIKSRFDQLTSIRSTKKRNIEEYFNIIRNQIATYAEDKMIVQAMKDFKRNFHGLGDNIPREEMARMADVNKSYYRQEFLARLNPNLDTPREVADYWTENATTIALQYHYISGNPFPTGKKHQLNGADDNSKYSFVHQYYHPVIKNFLEKFGYYDIFLIDNETGHLVYSVFKEVDFATSLKTGVYSNTNFGKVFNEVAASHEKGFVKLVDFEPYDPSYTAPASFIATSVYDGDDKIGVLVFQMPIDKINSIMTGDANWKDDGLGKSGETYLVGDDFKMRSQSRFLIEDKEGYLRALQAMEYNPSIINKINRLNTSILLQDAKTEAVKNALLGKTECKIVKDYRNIAVLSSYTSLHIQDVNWVILSDIDEEEVLEVIDDLRNFVS